MANKPTNPSEYDRRITIQRFGATIDDEGISTEAWIDVITIWADRKPLTVKEFFEASAVNAQKSVKYRIRYRTGMLSDMRLIDLRDNQTYNIRGVLDDYYGDHTQTHIIAELIENG
ncbi:MAG: phage head closure protein [Candidatus Pristimantibacillus lignocellulolyticus]|uniref:Phage head closure protein n=1 Tax=Candidatus Pristimantibacillus lignocellulolyticus TaxID=2994561 RepID=A0A9J6ZFA7_9BACL|nr:MAG: phage head closure protein [Candidatus Pristimantibacillus lignocellulolyticus]